MKFWRNVAIASGVITFLGVSAINPAVGIVAVGFLGALRVTNAQSCNAWSGCQEFIPPPSVIARSSLPPLVYTGTGCNPNITIPELIGIRGNDWYRYYDFVKDPCTCKEGGRLNDTVEYNGMRPLPTPQQFIYIGELAGASTFKGLRAQIAGYCQSLFSSTSAPTLSPTPTPTPSPSQMTSQVTRLPIMTSSPEPVSSPIDEEVFYDASSEMPSSTPLPQTEKKEIDIPTMATIGGILAVGTVASAGVVVGCAINQRKKGSQLQFNS